MSRNSIQTDRIRPLSSVKAKFAGLVVGATLVSCMAVGLLSYQIGKVGLIEASKLRLESVAANQSKEVTAYLDRVGQSLAEIAQNTAVGEATEMMVNIIPVEAPTIKKVFQPEGSTVEQRIAIDGSKQKLLYGVRHAAIHGTLSSTWKNANVSDILVADVNGTIVYTVTKGGELLTTLDDPANARLKELAERVKAGGDRDVHFSPF
ncbi:MAG: methyl-accepting chemotaxis protein, partial [Rhizobiaceae bacterium]|nr:methyl-accepting chemotaxis protein [Rhizobiaceae bacterium]